MCTACFKYLSKIKVGVVAVFVFILNIVWPPSCFLCRKYSKNVICNDCRKKCKLFRYGSSIDSEYGYKLPSVPSCRGIYAVGFYDGDYRKAIKDFKFNGALWIGKALADISYEMIERAGLLDVIDAISYVPVSDERLKIRGFDQSCYIAEIISKKSGLPCIHVLKRISQGKSQSKVGRAERIFQSKNRFQIDDKYFVPGHICSVLLIDDIITTGATMEECANILVNNGFIHVYGCVIATGRKDI